MKGFMKFCAISALCLLLAGVILIVAGSSAFAGGVISAVVANATNGRVSFQLSDWKDWGISILNQLDFVNYKVEDATSFNSNYPVLSGNIDKYQLDGGFSRIDIEVGGCTFTTRNSEDDAFYFEVEKTDKFQAYVEDGILYVKSVTTSMSSKAQNKCKIVFYVPAAYQFDHVRMELGAGMMDISDLHAGEASLEVGAGQIVTRGTVADQLELSVGMGGIELDGMSVNRLNISVGMGGVKAKGSVSGDIKAECSMGSVEMTLEGSRNDFNYTLDCAMGTIELGGEEYSGMAVTKSISNGAGKSIKADCSMGSMTIRFTK